MLDDYFRSAQHRVKVYVMEVECWKAKKTTTTSRRFRRGSSLESSAVTRPPDLVIPFCSYVEVGLLSNVNCFTPDADVLPTWPDLVASKPFARSGGLTTPDVAVNMRPAEVGQEPKHLRRSQYTQIVVANLPNVVDGLSMSAVDGATGIPAPAKNVTSATGAKAADPHTNANPAVVGTNVAPGEAVLDLHLVSAKSSYSSLLCKKSSKKRTPEILRKALAADRVSHKVACVDIRCSGRHRGSTFPITVDGQVFGGEGFNRVRIGPCKAAPHPLTVPVMTFLPPQQHCKGEDAHP